MSPVVEWPISCLEEHVFPFKNLYLKELNNLFFDQILTGCLLGPARIATQENVKWAVQC